MAKKGAELEDAQKLTQAVADNLGGICNDAYDAIEEDLTPAQLKTIIERGYASIKQYENVFAKLKEVHANQFKQDYERKINRLRDNIQKLEKKLGGK